MLTTGQFILFRKFCLVSLFSSEILSGQLFLEIFSFSISLRWSVFSRSFFRFFHWSVIFFSIASSFLSPCFLSPCFLSPCFLSPCFLSSSFLSSWDWSVFFSLVSSSRFACNVILRQTRWEMNNRRDSRSRHDSRTDSRIMREEDSLKNEEFEAVDGKKSSQGRRCEQFKGSWYNVGQSLYPRLLSCLLLLSNLIQFLSLLEDSFPEFLLSWYRTLDYRKDEEREKKKERRKERRKKGGNEKRTGRKKRQSSSLHDKKFTFPAFSPSSSLLLLLLSPSSITLFFFYCSLSLTISFLLTNPIFGTVLTQTKNTSKSTQDYLRERIVLRTDETNLLFLSSLLTSSKLQDYKE